MAKLMHFFLDFDMRCSHFGIVQFLKKKKIKITEDDFIVFMNTKRNMIKMLCKGKSTILHYRSETRIFDPGIIQYLPKYVDGDEMNIDAAVKEHLIAMMNRKNKGRG